MPRANKIWSCFSYALAEISFKPSIFFLRVQRRGHSKGVVCMVLGFYTQMAFCFPFEFTTSLSGIFLKVYYKFIMQYFIVCPKIYHRWNHWKYLILSEMFLLTINSQFHFSPKTNTEFYTDTDDRPWSISLTMCC